MHQPTKLLKYCVWFCFWVLLIDLSTSPSGLMGRYNIPSPDSPAVMGRAWSLIRLYQFTETIMWSQTTVWKWSFSDSCEMNICLLKIFHFRDVSWLIGQNHVERDGGRFYTCSQTLFWKKKQKLLPTVSHKTISIFNSMVCFGEFFISRSLRRKLLTGIGIQGGVYLLSSFGS